MEGTTVVAKPGEIREFIDSRQGTWIFTEAGKSKVFRGQVIPLDDSFTPARAYVWMKEHHLERLRSNSEAFHHRYLLCHELTQRFPDHELAETFGAMACDHYADWERLRTMGKTDWSGSITTISRYLTRYPNGKNAARLRFKRFELQTDPYEYEGSTRLILQNIERYQEYLVNRSEPGNLDLVRAKLARLYAMAFECFPESNERERQWVRSKALKLYGQLAISDDLDVRQRAQVAIFNLEHGRRVYSGPNHW